MRRFSTDLLLTGGNSLLSLCALQVAPRTAPIATATRRLVMLTLSVFNPLSFETRTETAVQLAVAACQQGLRVAVIDSSPTRNDLQAWLDARELNAEVKGELCLWENLLGEPLSRSMNELADLHNAIGVCSPKAPSR